MVVVEPKPAAKQEDGTTTAAPSPKSQKVQKQAVNKKGAPGPKSDKRGKKEGGGKKGHDSKKGKDAKKHANKNSKKNSNKSSKKSKKDAGILHSQFSSTVRKSMSNPNHICLATIIVFVAAIVLAIALVNRRPSAPPPTFDINGDKASDGRHVFLNSKTETTPLFTEQGADDLSVNPYAMPVESDTEYSMPDPDNHAKPTGLDYTVPACYGSESTATLTTDYELPAVGTDFDDSESYGVPSNRFSSFSGPGYIIHDLNDSDADFR